MAERLATYFKGVAVADRTVSVRLQAEVGSYIAGMSQAAAATMRLGESATTAGNKSRGAFDLAGKGPLLLGAAAVAGFGMAANASMDFEKSMSAVQAATHGTASDMDKLRDAAMKAGADTAYSATEAADAITELSKAGVSTADIMGGGLTGALSLAAAGQLDVADAAGIAAVAMTQFHLAGEDLPHVADLLAAGAGKAMGSVDDLGQALNQAGLIASAAGWSIEETTGVLAAFAAAGLVGSDAGTSLKTMLQRLQNPSKEAAATMTQFGISLYDASGNIVDADALAGQLATGLGGLTPAARDAAMAVIFGSDAVRGANVLYADGAAGIANWTAAVDDAGYAADTASALQNNLSGDLEKLGGSFDTLMISLGSGLQGPLRVTTQLFGTLLDGVAWLVDAFTSLPGPVLAGVGVLTALMLINGPLAGAIGSSALALASWVGSAMAAAEGAGVAAAGMGVLRGAASGLLGLMGGPIGLALTAVTVGLGFLIPALSHSGDAAEEFTQSEKDLAQALMTSKGAIDANVRAAAAKAASDAGLLDVAEQMHIPLSTVTDAILHQGGAYNTLQAALTEARDAGLDFQGNQTELSLAADHGKDALADLAGQTEGNVATSQQLAAATAETGTAFTQMNVTLGLSGDALDTWRDDVGQTLGSFVDPVGVYNNILQGMAQHTADATGDASASWQDYADGVKVNLDDVATELQHQIEAQQNWRTNIVLVTQAGGIEVGQALADMGTEGAGLVQAMVDSIGTEQFGELRDLIVTNTQLGGAGAVASLEQQMQVMAAVSASGGSATVQGLAYQLGIGADVVRGIAAQYGANLAEGINPILQALGQTLLPLGNSWVGRLAAAPTIHPAGFIGPVLGSHAEGGYTGNGGKYEPAGIVHRGEYVLTKEQTSRLGINEIERFANQGYANGGFVTAASVPRPYSTAPYGSPLSTAGDAAMQKEYTATTGWMNYLAAVAAANAAAQGGVLGTGAVSGGWGSIWNWIKARVPQARINSTYRPGDPGYHGKNKAVDIGFGSGPGGNGSAGLALVNRTLFDGLGGSLAELIYDGVGDDRADIKNGRPHTYNAATQAEHHNHVHAAVYDDGGLATGAGYLAKATVAPERVLSPRQTAAFEQWMTGREFSGASGGSRPANVVVNARVFVGNQEITDIARVEAEGVVVAALTGSVNRGNYNG